MVSFNSQLNSFTKRLNELDLKINDENKDEVRADLTGLFNRTCHQSVNSNADLEVSVERWLFEHLDEIQEDKDNSIHTISEIFRELFNDHSIEQFEQVLNSIANNDEKQLLEMLEGGKLDPFQQASILIHLLSKDPNRLPKLLKDSSVSEKAASLALKTICPKLDKNELLSLAHALLNEGCTYILGSNLETFVEAGLTQENVNSFAAIVAEKKPWAFAHNIKDFAEAGLTQENVNSLAGVLVEKDPKAFAYNIKAFVEAGLTQENVNSLAKIVAEKDPGAFAYNIKDFADSGLTQENVNSLDEIVAEKDPWAFARKIKAFVYAGLTQENVNSLAKIVAVKEPFRFACEFKDFLEAGLTPENVNSLAEIVAREYPEIIAKTIKDLVEAGLSPENVNSLAAIVAEKKARAFVYNIKDFVDAGLSPENVNSLAGVLVEKSPWVFEDNMKAIVEASNDVNSLVKIVAEKYYRAFADNIEVFVEASNDVNSLAVIVVERDPGAFADNIKPFAEAGLTQENVNSFAAIVAEKKPRAFAYNIKAFAEAGLTEEHVNSFAVIVVENNPKAFADNIKDFAEAGLTQEHVNSFAAIVAKRAPRAFAKKIKAFVYAGLTQENVNSLARIVAKRDPKAFANNIKAFADAGLIQENVNSFAVIVAEKEPRAFAYSIKDFIEAGLKNDNVGRLAIKVYLSTPNEYSEFFFNPFSTNIDDVEVHSIVEKIKNELHNPEIKEEDNSIIEILENLKKTEAPNRNTVLIWTLYALASVSILGNPKIPRESIYKYLLLISKCKDRQTRQTLTKLLFNKIAEDEEKVKPLNSLLKHTDTLLKGKSGNFATAIKHFSISLASLDVNQEQLKGILTSISQKKQFFKDRKNQYQLISLLSVINTLDSPQNVVKSIEILQEIFKLKTKHKIKQKLNSFSALIKLDPGRIQEVNELNQIENLYLKKFKELIPIGDIENLGEKYLEVFGASPGALPLYASVQKNNPAVLKALATFVTWAVERQFNNRYNPESSVHLETLFKDNKTLLEKWIEEVDLKKISLGERKSDDSRSANIKSTLHNVIGNDNHLNGDYDRLKNWIKNQNRDEVVKALNSDLKKDPENISLLFQLKIIDLYQAKEGAEIRRLTKELKVLCEKLKENEFANDIEGLIEGEKQASASNLSLIDTDDPFYLLTAGEVGGSCQRLDGGPDLNQCLTGYLIDGKNRMIALVDDQKNLKARSFVRLLLDKNNNPILFLERAYPGNMSAENRDMIIQGAIEKAKQLGVPLLSSQMGRGEGYRGVIQSTGSYAPYEYADAGAGVTEGVWSVRDSYILWKPDIELEVKD